MRSATEVRIQSFSHTSLIRGKCDCARDSFQAAEALIHLLGDTFLKSQRNPGHGTAHAEFIERYQEVEKYLAKYAKNRSLLLDYWQCYLTLISSDITMRTLVLMKFLERKRKLRTEIMWSMMN